MFSNTFTISAQMLQMQLSLLPSIYPTCSDVRVMWDQKSGRLRGFGFVSFRNQQDTDNAINQMTGKTLGSRTIWCNWAVKSSSGNPSDDKQNSEMKFDSNASNNTSANGSADLNISAGITAGGTRGQPKGGAQTLGPENNPLYTTIYVGNLPHEVTQTELHRSFLSLNVGVIEVVRVQRDKGFEFVCYQSHEEVALAIQLANGRVIGGKYIKCYWGSKPTLPRASSNALPPPLAPFPGALVTAQGLNQGYSTADILAYRQLNMSQEGGGQPLLPLSSQQGLGLGLGHGPMGVVGPAGNQNVYDNFQAGARLPVAAATGSMRQQMMYYQ